MEWRPPIAENRLLVLGWHNVDATPGFPARPGAGRRGLVAQLRLLRRLAPIVPLQEHIDAVSTGRPVPRFAVALTFDDGYRDNATVALPILRDLGIPATFFLVPEFLSRAREAWWERLGDALHRATVPSVAWCGQQLPLGDAAAARRAMDLIARDVKKADLDTREKRVQQVIGEVEPRSTSRVADLFLDWDEARSALAGAESVGSHSYSHAILSRQQVSDQRDDLALARRELQEGFGESVDLLAYPNGTAADYTSATLAAAGQAGHRHALTTVGGLNSPRTAPLELRRSVVYPERGAAGLLTVLRDTLARG